jgi:hypothetical protein
VGAWNLDASCGHCRVDTSAHASSGASEADHWCRRRSHWWQEVVVGWQQTLLPRMRLQQPASDTMHAISHCEGSPLGAQYYDRTAIQKPTGEYSLRRWQRLGCRDVQLPLAVAADGVQEGGRRARKLEMCRWFNAEACQALLACERWPEPWFALQ